jgi:hypothetical protein
MPFTASGSLSREWCGCRGGLPPDLGGRRKTTRKRRSPARSGVSGCFTANLARTAQVDPRPALQGN